jgi:hypothetical protein
LLNNIFGFNESILLVWKFVMIKYNYHLALQTTMVQISTNFGMWKTGSAKRFSQTLEKVPFRFRIWKTENGKREREKNGFANSQFINEHW